MAHLLLMLGCILFLLIHPYKHHFILVFVTLVLTTPPFLRRVDRTKIVKATVLCSTSLALVLGLASPQGAIAPPSHLSSNPPTSPTEDNPASKNANVLVIHSYHPELSWTQQEKEGIDQGFANSHHAVTVYHEFLDAKRYPDLSHHQVFLDYLQTKYQDTSLDVLMIADDPGLQLLLDVKPIYFPELPVVFMGINNVQEELLNIPWLTGVFETHSTEETLWVAQQHTESERIIVITDSSETGQANRAQLEALNLATVNQGTPIGRSFIFVEDVPANQVQQILGPYPDDMPIVMQGQLRQDHSDGALIEFEQETEILRSQLPNPIYTDSAMRLGHGAVGGKVLDGRFHAEQAVQLVEQILDGIPVNKLSPIIESKNQWMFDAQELERINVDLEALPPDSELINRKLSFYDQYRLVVWSAFVLFSLSGLIILVLANAIRLQKRAESDLKENEKYLEDRVNARTEELRLALDNLQETQAKLIQHEKSSSLGRLMGGIAHEFNNPLGFIIGNIKCLEGYLQSQKKLFAIYQTQTATPLDAVQYSQEIDFDYIQEDIPKVMASITHGADRIQHLVQTLNEFVRVNEEGFKPTNLNQSLDNTLLILSSQLAEDIAVIKDYETLPSVHCNPRDLNQVFMSILLNAIEALAVWETEPKQIHLKTGLLSKNWVQIRISDTGPGIAPEHLAKIFDPFFTTKAFGQGMGMSLALCYRTIQHHQGRLTCVSTLDQGATFVIDLPINAECHMPDIRLSEILD